MKLPLPLAIRLQKRFGILIKEIVDHIKNGRTEKIVKLMSFPLPEEWKHLLEDTENVDSERS